MIFRLLPVPRPAVTAEDATGVVLVRPFLVLCFREGLAADTGDGPVEGQVDFSVDVENAKEPDACLYLLVRERHPGPLILPACLRQKNPAWALRRQAPAFLAHASGSSPGRR